jgi:choline dehydrogenase
LIDPRYLSAPADRITLEQGIERARAIAESASCRKVGIGPEFLPGKADVHSHIRARSESAYHPVGACRLGIDDGAVVDPHLRVRGIDGLRIADASVMPTTVAGNAAAAVIAIAERAADLIRQAPRDAPHEGTRRRITETV